MFFKKKHKHKPNLYQHTFTKQQAQAPKYKYNSLVFKTFFHCINIFQTNRSYKGLFQNLSGVLSLTPLIDCVGIGDRINFYKNATRFYYFIYAGSVIQLKYLKIGFIVSNIGFNTGVWSLSNGTYSKVLNLKTKSARLKLASGINLEISTGAYCLIGRNSGIYSYKQYKGKASVSLNGRHRIIVRSCAKNPVDHPNGGRTRGKMLFKTPWGKVAKSNK